MEIGFPIRLHCEFAVLVNRQMTGRQLSDAGEYGLRMRNVLVSQIIIDRAGIIRYKHIGPLTPQVIAEKLDPLIDGLQQTGGAP